MKTRDELLAEREEHSSRLQEIDTTYAGQYLDPESDDGKEFAQRESSVKELDRTIAQIDQRGELIRSLGTGGNGEPGTGLQVPRSGVSRGEDIYDLSTVRSSVSDPAAAGQELKERAKRAIDMSRPKHPDVDEAEAKNNAERLLDTDSDDGRFSRYLLATGSPTYKRAFGKVLSGSMLNQAEQRAVEFAQMAERALSLTGSAGGYAVPFELDPTILNTSNGVVNPIRQLARVEQITVDEWRGVTSTGITAAYAAEATETTDNAPTLAQPTVSTEKAQAWVPFSIEVGQDWSGLQTAMAALLQDAKDTLEAGKFISGSGTNEPFGVITGATNTVNATTGQTFDAEDLFRLISALPPRYRPRGVFLGDLAIMNLIRQFDSSTNNQPWIESLQADAPARLLGKPFYEASEMADSAATGNKFLLFGDFSRYLIVDRVGLSVEVVPHVFGANQRPTGERGLYAYWRNGAKVLDANAFRVLVGIA